MVAGPESSSRGITDELYGQIGRRPARLVELDSVEAVKRAVRSGLGIAFLSQTSVSDEVSRGELRTFRLGGAPSTERWLELVVAENRVPTPVELALVTLLRATAAQASSTG